VAAIGRRSSATWVAAPGRERTHTLTALPAATKSPLCRLVFNQNEDGAKESVVTEHGAEKLHHSIICVSVLASTATRSAPAALGGSTQVACGHRSDSNAFPSARAVGNALRSRAAQRILTATCRAARLEMCSPEDRMPHEDPPHEAQAPPWLRTLGTRYPQPPRSFWARIGPPKTVESKLAHAGFAGATVNLVEVPRDASDWAARKWQSAHQGTCAAPRRGDAKELGEQLRPRAAGAERNHGKIFSEECLSGSCVGKGSIGKPRAETTHQ
jgi:hypothetical protein